MSYVNIHVNLLYFLKPQTFKIKYINTYTHIKKIPYHTHDHDTFDLNESSDKIGRICTEVSSRQAEKGRESYR